MNNPSISAPITRILPEQLKRKLEKHPLGRNLYITAIGFYPEQVAREINEPKGAPVYTLIYAAQGRGWLETGKKRAGYNPASTW